MSSAEEVLYFRFSGRSVCPCNCEMHEYFGEAVVIFVWQHVSNVMRMTTVSHYTLIWKSSAQTKISLKQC